MTKSTSKNGRIPLVAQASRPANGHGLSRRDLLRAATAAAAGLVWTELPAFGARVGAQRARTPLAIDVHAHLFPERYLDLVQGFGRADTGTQRGRKAGLAPG